jgi:mono/diheme cytochrome c family protein
MSAAKSIDPTKRAIVTLLLVPLAALLFYTNLGIAQEKTIKKVPTPVSSPASGKQMYKDYCAVCHGTSGKGDGPAASELKIVVPDLTTMAQRSNGKFSAEAFHSVMTFGTKTPAHGTADMPIWGPVFKHLHPDVSELRIANLSKYVESIQAK